MSIDRKEAPTPIANVEKDVADTTIASSNLRVGSMLSEGGLSSKRASAYVSHNPNKSVTSNTGTANMSGAYSAYHNPSSKHQSNASQSMYNDAGVIGNNRGSVALNSSNRDFFSRIWIEIINFSNYAACNVKLLLMTRPQD